MIDFTVGKEARSIVRFAVPLILGQFIGQLYNVVDGIIVGQFVSDNALAAVGASFPIVFLLDALVIGICNGGSIVISQYFGAKDRTNVVRSIDTINLFLILSAIVVTIIGVAFSESIFHFINLPSKIIPDAKQYLTIYFLGTIGSFGYHGVCAILRGLGDSTRPLYCLIISSIANIVFDLLFVGWFGWGISGAAWATIIAQISTFLGLAIYLNRTDEFVKIRIRNVSFNFDIFRTIVKIGLPSGIQNSFVGLGNMTMLWIVNGFDATTITAYTIAGRIEMLATVPASALSAALSTFVGHNIGARHFERIKSGTKFVARMAFVVAIFVGLAVVIFRQNIIGAFTNDSEIISIASEYLTIIGCSLFTFYLLFVANGVLRGAGDTLVHMVITLFSLWIIRIPLSYILSLHFGTFGIWIGIPSGWLVGMLIAGYYYKIGYWKKKSII